MYPTEEYVKGHTHVGDFAQLRQISSVVSMFKYASGGALEYLLYIAINYKRSQQAIRRLSIATRIPPVYIISERPSRVMKKIIIILLIIAKDHILKWRQSDGSSVPSL